LPADFPAPIVMIVHFAPDSPGVLMQLQEGNRIRLATRAEVFDRHAAALRELVTEGTDVSPR
jgi:hypothetical protein